MLAAMGRFQMAECLVDAHCRMPGLLLTSWLLLHCGRLGHFPWKTSFMKAYPNCRLLGERRILNYKLLWAWREHPSQLFCFEPILTFRTLPHGRTLFWLAVLCTTIWELWPIHCQNRWPGRTRSWHCSRKMETRLWPTEGPHNQCNNTSRAVQGWTMLLL